MLHHIQTVPLLDIVGLVESRLTVKSWLEYILHISSVMQNFSLHVAECNETLLSRNRFQQVGAVYVYVKVQKWKFKCILNKKWTLLCTASSLVRHTSIKDEADYDLLPCLGQLMQWECSCAEIHYCSVCDRIGKNRATTICREMEKHVLNVNERWKQQ